MTKKEIIWRDILTQYLEKKTTKFTQKDLAQKFGFSLSTIFNSLKTPREAQIIEVSGRDFRIRDFEKFLYLWATFRTLKKDIIYSTYVKNSVFEIEANTPPNAIFGGYSAFRKKFNEAPADYDKVYVYAENLEKIKKRFPETKAKSHQNLIVLQADKFLKNYGSITPLAQLFVDLWNLPEWYAKDFLNVLREKIL
ncbi:MAG: hypothetical protein AB1465_04595 [Patescibacteria group bacterium]